MKSEKLKHNKNGYFDGPLILKPNIFEDSRGYFFESWNKNLFCEKIGYEINFVQDNQSSSKKAVLRGLHYQLPPNSQGKLVRCSYGSVYDVIVDLRKNSRTFSFWAGIELNAKENLEIWIPEGFAHGFLSLEENTIFEYKVTNFWSSAQERSLIWNDPSIEIKWPKLSNEIIISKKDSEAYSLDQIISHNQLF